MAFVDFSELKAKVSFGKTCSILGLDLKQAGNQWRGVCPTCKTGGDRALVITEGKGYFCFADSKGGDQIALVGHILNLSVKEAAAHLAQAAGIVQVPSTNTSTVRTVPESESGKQGERTLAPLAYLETDHPAVDAIGFDTEVAKTLGIGYAPRGIMRGTVAVPIRDEDGQLVGYLGITEARLPPNFQSNVVKFPKSA